MTARAEVGASVDAMVGQMTMGTPSFALTALAVSSVFPPPNPMTQPTPLDSPDSTKRSISVSVHSPSKTCVTRVIECPFLPRPCRSKVGRMFWWTKGSTMRSPLAPSNLDTSDGNILMAPGP
eukprot:CAMPEP_0172449216 /NCGR_PEP_ID=MMETSP1065-20121228/7978_1 /TAXON_ID=265537 /ORGANISM="Amphiprora paludosa, Strain CCMP125" /LENGTH=121 /DNA_ID=CAMNT_0013200839 /DNA_START=26 /DNA_END=391 /DNA_ORIENTATION=+